MADKKTYSMQDLIDVMRALRDPDGGCPWDLEQSFETIGFIWFAEWLAAAG